MDFKINYNQLVKRKSGDKITYQELLITQEWQTKRKDIISRDCNKCQICNNEATESIKGKHYRKLSEDEIKAYKGKNIIRETEIKREFEAILNRKIDGPFIKCAIPVSILTDRPIIPHVHHRYYIQGKLPWEYEPECFVTVCQDCHFNIHKEQDLPVYQDEERTIKLRLTTCDRCYGAGIFPEYSHIQNGVCFLCNGAKYLELI